MRSNTLDAARRAYGGFVRGTLHASSDSTMMQTADVRLLHNELLTSVERFQCYGHSSVPLPPDEHGSKAAEVVVGFIGGNRSHPVVVSIDDRRYRPKNWKPGESGLYDHQGQTIHITNDGIKIGGGSKKLPLTIEIGSSSVTIADGKVTIKADDIVLDGNVKLGGADADKPAAMLGSIDSAGDAEQSNLATKVMMK